MTEPDLETALNDLPEEEVEISTAPVKGRDVQVRRLNSVQFMQLQHEATVLEGDRYDTARKRKSLDRAFRIIHSTFVDEDDHEYIQDLIADGELTMRELVRIVIQASRGSKEDEKQVAQIRRGRPRTKR